MNKKMLFKTAPVKDVQIIKGISFPAQINFRQLLITGPPGSGKSTLIRKLGGWSEEGYINLALNKWWTAQALSLRPREIHMGFPFKGHKEALAVFDRLWVEASPQLEMDFERIILPPEKRFFFSVNWRERYVFEFLLPPADLLLERRLQRSRKGTHRVDTDLGKETIEKQLEVYRQAAHYLHRNGIKVYLREDMDGVPLDIIDSGK